jgi:hypothetical protein
MTRKSILAMAAVSLAFFTHATMASTYIQCDTCTIEQLTSTALAHGVGRYVVGNISTNSVVAVKVYQSSHQNAIGAKPVADTDALYTEDGNITAAETAAFTTLVNFYNAAPVGYQKQYTLQIVPAGTSADAYKPISSAYDPSLIAKGPHPLNQPAPGAAKVTYPDTGENAYSFVNSGAYQNAMLNWVGNQTVLGLNSTISNAVNSSILHTLAPGQAPAVFVTVVFTDGSHIGVAVDFTQSPPALVVNETSAVDSHGNNIPATMAAITGSGKQIYNFANPGNPNDSKDMTQQIEAFGVSPPSGSSATGAYACVSTQNKVTCTWVLPN